MSIIDESDNIIMRFIDATLSFSLGFECGQFFFMLMHNIQIENSIAHNKNVPQLAEMAKIFNKKLIVKELIIDESIPKDLVVYFNDYVEISFEDADIETKKNHKKPKLSLVK